MKKYFLLVLASSFLAVVCCQDESGIEKEKKAIISVIEAEKIAYYAQDLAGLDKPWVQEQIGKLVENGAYPSPLV